MSMEVGTSPHEDFKEPAGEYIPVKSIDEEFSRTNHLCNSHGLTESEKVLKVAQVKELARLYPTVPDFWLEMVWQFHHDHPEKAKEIEEKDLYREKPTKYQTGGILKSVSVEEGCRGDDDILYAVSELESNPQTPKEITMNA
jgi:hypothetical protein